MAAETLDTIWKYPLPYVATDIDIPTGGTVLTVAEQHGQIVAWVRVDPAQPVQQRTFFLVGTGQFVPDAAARHVGTVLLDGEHLVLHVFEAAPVSQEGGNR